MAEGNSVSDEIKAQHKKLAGKTPKEKFQYFWEYYRIPTLVTILVAAFAANLIYTIVTAKDSALSVLFINGYSEMDTEAFMSGFDEYAQIDTKEYSTSLEMNFTIQEEATDQYTMANVQKLMALVAAKELDVIMADTSTFTNYAEPGYFCNLMRCCLRSLSISIRTASSIMIYRMMIRERFPSASSLRMHPKWWRQALMP